MLVFISREEGCAMKKALATLAVFVLFGGTAAAEMSPSVAVMPGKGKPFKVFQQDQAACKQYANNETAAAQRQAAQQGNQVATGAVVGGIIGGILGGGHGAAAGAAGGASDAADAQAQAQADLQQRYDDAYSQCMYAKGNQVPGWD
jgi:uncharacterized protein YcfJ